MTRNPGPVPCSNEHSTKPRAGQCQWDRQEQWRGLSGPLHVAHTFLCSVERPGGPQPWTGGDTVHGRGEGAHSRTQRRVVHQETQAPPSRVVKS